jgi:hypothetical protein
MPAARPARTDPTLYEWDRLSPEQQQAVLETIGGARAADSRSMRRTMLVIALVIVLALALLATLVAAIFLSQGRLLG